MAAHTNPFAAELIRDIKARFSDDASTMPVSEWICRNTTLRGLPFSFKKFPFQKAIADDMHPNLSVMKISQVGITEVQVRKAAAFVARNRGRVLLFTFPDEKMQKKNSQTRIQPLIAENRVFNLDLEAGVPQIRSYSTIQIGTSFMMVTACQEGEATSQPADVIFNDEIDLSDQANLALFSSRMQASDLKIRQQFSTPTFEGYGISQSHEVSDQQEYFVKCDCCNHWQVPLFDPKWVRIPNLSSDIPLIEIDQNLIDKKGILLESGYVACEKCGRGLDLSRADNRNWVARYPSRTNARGYRVRPFSVSTLPVSYILQQLLDYKKRGFLRGWYNTVIGECYQEGDIRLTEGQIRACITPQMSPPDIPHGTPVFIGIDLGMVCHITLLAPRDRINPSVSNMEVILFKAVKESELMEEVAALRRKYLIPMGTCDRFPYTPTANALFDASNGTIMPCEYRGSAEVADKIESNKCIQANRTDLLDTVAALVRRGELPMSGYGTQADIIVTHLMDMYREETPEKQAVWKKLNGRDHFFHSLGFALTAVKVYTGDYTGPGSTPTETKETVYIGGADMTAQEYLTNLIGGQAPKSNFRQQPRGFSGLGFR